MHSFRSAALMVSATKNDSERTAEHVDMAAREAGPDVIKLRPRGENACSTPNPLRRRRSVREPAAEAKSLLRSESFFALRSPFPEFSSGERTLRSAREKLKRQGTPRGRKRGMSHDVAAFRAGRIEKKGLTGGAMALKSGLGGGGGRTLRGTYDRRRERARRDALWGSGQADASRLEKLCGEGRESYFTSQVSPARRSLARSPGPRLAMTAWTCSFITSS